MNIHPLSFAAPFDKLPDALRMRLRSTERFKLIQVLPVNKKDLTPLFIEYDTGYTLNPVTDDKEYFEIEDDILAMLFFRCADGSVFTTLRGASPAARLKGWQDMVGDMFEAHIEDNGVGLSKCCHKPIADHTDDGTEILPSCIQCGNQSEMIRKVPKATDAQ